MGVMPERKTIDNPRSLDYIVGKFHPCWREKEAVGNALIFGGRRRQPRAAAGSGTVSGNPPPGGRTAKPGPVSPVPLLWPGDLGIRPAGPAVRQKPAAHRRQGHGEERPLGKLGHGLWPSRLERVLPRQRGRRQPHRHGHLRGRAGGFPARAYLPMRKARGLRRPGRDQHGPERGPGGASLRPGFPALSGRARLRPPAHGGEHPLHRHHELRLHRDPGAERGTGLPVRGAANARHQPGKPGPAPLPALSRPAEKAPAAVLPAVLRAPGQM